jgi:5S rRNA maturation endonuclease (ribonuclease M5)
MNNTGVNEREFIFVDDNKELLSIFEKVYEEKISGYPKYFFPNSKLLLAHLAKTLTKQLIIVLDYDLLEDRKGIQIADMIKKSFSDKHIIVAMFSNTKSPAELKKLDENDSVDWFFNKLGCDSFNRLGNFLKFFTQAAHH